MLLRSKPSPTQQIGARPAMGKSALALGMATHVSVVERKPVLFFSLEMSHLEITQRILSAEARVDATRMRNGKLAESDWTKLSLDAVTVVWIGALIWILFVLITGFSEI